MANPKPKEDTDMSDAGCESSDSMVTLTIKTLEPKSCSIQVGKDMSVLHLKEKIARKINTLAEKQRLIYNGIELKNDKLLSAYLVKNEHTLYLVTGTPGGSVEVTNVIHDTRACDVTASSPNISESSDFIETIPDSPLLLELLNDLEAPALSDNEYKPNQVLAVPVPSTLSSCVRKAREFLNGRVVFELAHFEARLKLEGNSVDPVVRDQVRREALQVRITMRDSCDVVFKVDRAIEAFTKEPVKEVNAESHSLQGNEADEPPPLTPLMEPIFDTMRTLARFLSPLEEVYQPTQGENNTNRLTEEQATNAPRMLTSGNLSCIVRIGQLILRWSAVPALWHFEERLLLEGNSVDPIVRGEIRMESLQVKLMVRILTSLLIQVEAAILMFLGERII